MDHLRSKRRMRRSRHASVHGHSQGRIVDAISIRERPAEVEDRAIPGHWEGDLLAGAKNRTFAASADAMSVHDVVFVIRMLTEIVVTLYIAGWILVVQDVVRPAYLKNLRP